MGRNRFSAAGAWEEQRWKHKGGKGIRTTFTVSEDAGSKRIRVREEGVYQQRLKELFDRLSLLYGESEPMPPALAWDYLVLGTPLYQLYFSTGYEQWKKEYRLESRLRVQSGLFRLTSCAECYQFPPSKIIEPWGRPDMGRVNWTNILGHAFDAVVSRSDVSSVSVPNRIKLS